MRTASGLFIILAVTVVLTGASTVLLSGEAPGSMPGSGGKGSEALRLDADSLLSGIDRYAGRSVEIEGKIVHVCGASLKKLKLLTPGGGTVRIVAGGGIEKFSDTLKDKRVVVKGKVSEKRLNESYIESIENDRKMLCHVDYQPCLAKDWIAKQEAAGKADSSSIRATNRMRERLADSGKEYISVVTVTAESVEIVPEAGSSDAVTGDAPESAVISPDTIPDSEKLVIVWTSGDREVALKMVFMYAFNAKKYGWWKDITLVVWGPSAKLLSEDAELQEYVKKIGDVGVNLLACKGCSDLYGVSGKLEQLGITVKYIGVELTEFVKGERHVLTF